MPFKSIHVAVDGKMLCVVVAKQYFTVCVCLHTHIYCHSFIFVFVFPCLWSQIQKEIAKANVKELLPRSLMVAN